MRLRIQQYGNKNIIGKNVERIRKEQGRTQYELAQATHMHPSNLSKIEGQVRECRDYELLALAKALQVSVLDLLCAPGSFNGR